MNRQKCDSCQKDYWIFPSTRDSKDIFGRRMNCLHWVHDNDMTNCFDYVEMDKETKKKRVKVELKK